VTSRGCVVIAAVVCNVVAWAEVVLEELNENPGVFFVLSKKPEETAGDVPKEKSADALVVPDEIVFDTRVLTSGEAEDA